MPKYNITIEEGEMTLHIEGERVLTGDVPKHSETFSAVSTVLVAAELHRLNTNIEKFLGQVVKIDPVDGTLRLRKIILE